MRLEQARLIAAFIVIVTIICASIASCSQHDKIVSTLCKRAGHKAASNAICR